MVLVAVQIEILMVEAHCHCHSHLAEEEVVEGAESHLQVFVDHYCYHHLDEGVRDLVGHLAVEGEEPGDLQAVLEVPAVMGTEHYCHLSEGVEVAADCQVEEGRVVFLVVEVVVLQVVMAADCQVEEGRVVFLVVEVVVLQAVAVQERVVVLQVVEKGVVPAAVAEIWPMFHQQLYFHWHTSDYERVSFPVLSKHRKAE